MKRRIIIVVAAAILLLCSYYIYNRYILTQPRGVVDSFLHALLRDHETKGYSDINPGMPEEGRFKFLEYISPELKTNSFLHLAFLDLKLNYRIIRTEKLTSQRVKVWVAIRSMDGKRNRTYEKIVVPFVTVKDGTRWYITSLPELNIYKYGVPKLTSDNSGNKLWSFSVGPKALTLEENPSKIIPEQDQPVSFILLDGRLLHLKRLQPLYLTRVMSMTSENIEDIKLGYFRVEGDFPVYSSRNGELSYVGKRLIPAGTEKVTIYRSADGIGQMAVLPHTDKVKKSIRVMLYNTGYTEMLHKTVKISCTGPYTVECPVDNIKYDLELGDIIQFRSGSNSKIEFYKNGKRIIDTSHRWFIRPEGDSRLRILNINRMNSANGTAYRGSMEISLSDNKLCLVNEVNLEEYLYSVVPSEMPVDFGLEALKVQAVAARSYAVRAITSNDYLPFGAHVVDSTSSQVYNNIVEADIAIRAVNETAGLVPFFDGRVIKACFFSTSCGYTAGSHEVWSDWDGSFPSQEIPYLQANSQYSGNAPSLYNEKNFRAFINQRDLPAYDKFSPFFRWSVTISREQLEAVLNKTLKALYTAQPDFILTRTADNSFKSLDIPEDIGELLNIEVIRRGTGGNIMELDISTSQGTYRIIKEYNIRQTLKPVNYANGHSSISLSLYDNTVRYDFPLLPSAFAYIDFTRDIEGNIKNMVINGGGYGHGVGMSQHGTYGLTLLGKSFSEIIDHYYPKCELKKLTYF